MKKIILLSLLVLTICSACSLTNKTENTSDNSDENVNINTSVSNGNQNTSEDEPVSLAPAADTLSVALTLFRNKKEETVDISKTFSKDDGVRLNISTVEKGHITVLYKGSSGSVQTIFPNEEFYDGKNDITPNKNIIIPQKGWFFFDEKRGTETVYIIYSKENNSDKITANKEQTIKTFDVLRSQKDSETFTIEDGSLIRVIELKHE